MKLLPIIRLFTPSGVWGAHPPGGHSRCNQPIVTAGETQPPMQIVMLIGDDRAASILPDRHTMKMFHNCVMDNLITV